MVFTQLHQKPPKILGPIRVGIDNNEVWDVSGVKVNEKFGCHIIRIKLHLFGMDNIHPKMMDRWAKVFFANFHGFAWDSSSSEIAHESVK